MKFFSFIFCVFFQFSVSEEFYGTWHVRLSNWNTGRLYFADDYGTGPTGFGPVCKGTKEEAIEPTGKNGQRFGNRVSNYPNLSLKSTIFCKKYNFLPKVEFLIQKCVSHSF